MVSSEAILTTMASTGDSEEQPRQGRAIHWSRHGPLALAFVVWIAMIPATWVDINRKLHVVLYDDAMISMSYARTFAHTGDLVWFPGAPRVEGFSNPLWTAMMALFHLVGIPDRLVGLAVQLVGLALVLLSIGLVGALARRLDPNRPITATVARWAVAAFVPLTYWAVLGMEVVACAAVLVALAIALFDALSRREAPGAAVKAWLTAALALAIGSAVRLDVLVLAAPLVIVTLLTGGWRQARDAWPLTLCATALVIQELIRHRYYGEWVPNTFWLKGTGADLPEQMGTGAVVSIATLSAVLLPFLALVVLGYRRQRGQGQAVHAISLGCVLTGAVTIGYVVYVGGDFMDPGDASAFGIPNRFFSTTAPLLFPLAAIGALTLWERVPQSPRGRTMPQALVTSLVALLALGLAWVLWVGFWSASFVDTAAATRVVARLAILAVATCVAACLASYFRRRAAFLATAILMLVVWTNIDVINRLTLGHEYDVQLDRAVAGRALQDTMPPSTTIAVAAAGSLVYFSQLPAIDELGKMDPVIAEGPVLQHPFIAGHSKWNTRRSLLDLRPDVILDQWGVTPDISAELMARGYNALGILAGRSGGGPLIAPNLAVDAEELCRRLRETSYACAS